MSQRFFEGTKHATLYAKFRINPPQKLVDRIVSYVKEKNTGELSLGLDVGCGNGQCSAMLSPHFGRVLATDISPAQIEVAKTMNYPSNVEFQTCPAEEMPVESGSVQLVNACVAAHWFDLPLFFKEADRVLCPNGVIALASYFVPTLIHPTRSAQLAKVLYDFYSEKLGSYWGPGVKHLETEYANITLPYANTLREEVWTEETSHSLTDFVASMKTWSAYQNYCKALGDDAGLELLNEFTSNLQKALETTADPDQVEVTLKRKYFLVMGRKM